MRNLVLSVFLLLLIKVNAQTHKAIYSLKLEKNPITGDSSMADDINPLAENNEYYLYFDNENSYYTSLKVENGTKDLSDAMGGCYNPVKFNYKSKNKQFNNSFDKLYVVNNSNIPEWKITNETKEIAGYSCIKAEGIIRDITDRDKVFNVEAWFAPEIPYSVGPAEYLSLPGLVIYSVYENFQIFKLEKVIFNDNGLDINSIKFEGEELSEEKYIQLLKQDVGY